MTASTSPTIVVLPFPIKAAQRGVAGTRQILELLIEGCEFKEGQSIFVVEMLHQRFNEWPLATWQLQKSFLESGRGCDWFFAAFMTPDDADADEAVKCLQQAMYEVLCR